MTTHYTHLSNTLSQIVESIQEQKVIEFDYNNKPRLFCAAIVGTTKNGSLIIHGLEITNDTPAYKTMRLEQIKNLKVSTEFACFDSEKFKFSDKQFTKVLAKI